MAESIHTFRGRHGFLSNFFPVRVCLDNVTYRSVEHAFQAAKSLDPLHRARCVNAPGAGIAKRYGRHCRLRPDWEEVKIEIMRDLVRQKFAHPKLREQLLDTGDAELVEGNTWNDRFWGVCNGRGENWLGKILMDVRAEIIAAEQV